MDESRKPGDADSPGVPSPEDGSFQQPQPLGATGVFGAIPDSNVLESRGIEAGQQKKEGEIEFPFAQSSHAEPSPRQVFREPIVHKVVLGGSAAPRANILERLGAARPTAESTGPPGPDDLQSQSGVGAQTSSFPQPGSKPGEQTEGLTQILRSLSGDRPAVPPAHSPAPIQPGLSNPDPRPAEIDPGFTSQSQPLRPEGMSDQVKAQPVHAVSSDRNPPSGGTGGFTALLQGYSQGGTEARRTPTPFDKNAAGEFTQLFQKLAPEAASLSSPKVETLRQDATSALAGNVTFDSGGKQSGEQSSFTDLISKISEPPPQVTQGAEQDPILGNRSRDQSPAAGIPAVPSDPHEAPPDWSYGVSSRLQPESSLASGGEVTRLLHILQESSKTEPSSYVPPSEASAPSSGRGAFTDIYRKLDEPIGPASPQSPPSGPSPSIGGVTDSLTPRASVIDVNAGPSDVTIILEKSKLREAQRQGLASPGAPINLGSIPQPLPSTPAMPQTQAPPSFHWPPQAPPAATPSQPMPQFTPPAPAPQMPPPAPLPAAAIPPVMGKMQQYLPLFAIIIIFLLVVILVTMVFLLKR
jgi:hypothetical protein